MLQWTCRSTPSEYFHLLAGQCLATTTPCQAERQPGVACAPQTKKVEQVWQAAINSNLHNSPIEFVNAYRIFLYFFRFGFSASDRRFVFFVVSDFLEIEFRLKIFFWILTLFIFFFKNVFWDFGFYFWKKNYELHVFVNHLMILVYYPIGYKYIFNFKNCNVLLPIPDYNPKYVHFV